MMPLEALVDSLRKERSVVLSTHVSPDPDAIGSCFGLARILHAFGMDVFVWLHDTPQTNLLPWCEGIPWSTTVPELRWDAFVAVDTASRVRIGRAVDELMSRVARTYNIDHHVSNPGWAQFNYIDGNAAACAVMVWRIAKALFPTDAPLPIPQKTYDLLFGGLLDDTGRFCYPNAGPEAFQTGAELVALGAQPSVVAEGLYFSRAPRVLRLQGVALSKLVLECDGLLAMMTLTEQDLLDVGATGDDTEGLIDLARSVDGVVAAAFLREVRSAQPILSGAPVTDPMWKGSLRSKVDWLDVNLVASEFGGGGHRAASGFRLTGSREQVEECVRAAVRRAIEIARRNSGTE